MVSGTEFVNNVNDESKDYRFVYISFCTFAVLMGAFLLPYDGATNGHSLFHTPLNIGYNVGLIIVVLLNLVLCIAPKSRKYSFVTACAALLWWLPGIVGNTLSVLEHTNSLNIGSYLAYIGVLSLAVHVYMLLKGQDIEFKVTNQTFNLSLLGGAISTMWAVGLFLPWDKDVYFAHVPGYKFTASNSKVLTDVCCKMFTNRYSTSQSITYLTEMIFIIFGALLFCFLASRMMAGIGLIVLSIAFFGEPFNGLQSASNSILNLSDVYSGAALASAQQAQITVTRTMLSGMWINEIAALLLIIFGVFICISSKIKN